MQLGQILGVMRFASRGLATTFVSHVRGPPAERCAVRDRGAGG
jgi:hypothetical protein